MTNPRVWKASACVVAAMTVLGVALYHRGAAPRPGNAFVIEAEAAEGRQTFATLCFQPMETMASIEEVRALLAGAIPEQQLRSSDRPLDSMLEEASGIVFHRFAAQDASPYIEWCRSRGWKPRPREVLEGTWAIKDSYKFYFDREPDPDTPLESIFTELWAKGLLFGNGSSRPVGLARGGGSVCLARGILRRSNPVWPALECAPGRTGWTGTNCAMLRRWWTPASDLAALLKRFESVDVARLAFVVRTADGQSRPYFFNFVWNPDTSRWQVEHMGTCNFDESNPISTTEY